MLDKDSGWDLASTVDPDFDGDPSEVVLPEVTKPHAWRGDISPDSVAFIAKQHYRGASDISIAKMLGRPVYDVARFTALLDPIAPRTLTKPPVIFLHEVTPAPVTPLQEIAEAMAKKYRVSVADIRGQARTKDVVLARQAAFHEAYAILSEDGSRRFSLPAIGRWFGGRDHSTIHHGIHAHAKRLAEARASA